MKIALINGSPKMKNSASENILNTLKKLWRRCRLASTDKIKWIKK